MRAGKRFFDTGFREESYPSGIVFGWEKTTVAKVRENYPTIKAVVFWVKVLLPAIAGGAGKSSHQKNVNFFDEEIVVNHFEGVRGGSSPPAG